MAISKKALLEKMNGQRVIVTYEGMKTNEDNDALRQEILATMEAENTPASEFQEDDNYFRLGNKAWMKSHLVQGETGVLTMRSKDYYLTRDRDGNKVYGDIPKANSFKVLPGGKGFTKSVQDGKASITYCLAD